MTDIYRILRVIEVVGTLEFINNQKIHDLVKGTKQVNYEGVQCYVSSEYIGEPIPVQRADPFEQQAKANANANALADKLNFALMWYGSKLHVKAMAAIESLAITVGYVYECNSYEEAIGFLNNVSKQV